MGSFLSDALAVYRSEGPKILFTKGIRTLLEPVVGANNAQLYYHNLNRLLSYRSADAPTFDIPYNVVGIQDPSYHTFFGFYDHTPFCPSNRRVLYNRTTADPGPVDPSDRLEICYFNLEENQSVQFGETTTWNWQKGCRLQWFNDDSVIYNKLVDGGYGAVVQDVTTGEVLQQISYPVYDVGPDRKTAVSINFSRLERLHFDYGYTNFPDETRGEFAPANDGIFLVDLEDGIRELLVSYDELASVTDTPRDVESYVMNLMFSPDGSRVSFLHRYHLDGSRKTNLLCIEIDSGDLTVLQSDNEASHPTWRSDRELLSTVNYWGARRKTEFIVYDVVTGDQRTINHSSLSEDTHPSFSPVDSNVFVGDTYPDHCGNRHLFIYSIKDDHYDHLGSVYGPVQYGIKRDFHPRWDRKGSYVCIDAPRPNYRRSIFIIDLKQTQD